MKKYLDDFFAEYAYASEDAKILSDSYNKIILNPETAELWDQAISLYDESINCDYEKIIGIADEVAKILYLQEYTVELLIFICLSEKTEKVYAENGIGRQIYHDTMLDLKYKMEECKLVKGIVGTFVPNWFVGFFNLTRFTLGRLQFEIVSFDDTYEKDGNVLKPNSKVVNTHIPRNGLPLDDAGCDAAFEMAKEFFVNEIGDKCPFVCNSWLLYPENENILSKGSNTYRFMKRFDIFKWNVDKDRKNLWRLFDTDEKDVNKLPADSSMRSAYIHHLKNGGKLGVGKGVFFL